jgi:signal transduction histidine kinase
MHNLLNEKIIEFMSLHKMNLFIDRLEALSSILNQKKGYLVMYGCLALIYFGFNYNLIKYQISKYKEHEEAENEIFEKAQEKNQKINLIDQVEIFSAIQHELANCIPTLINDFNDFIDYLNINTDFKNELKKPIFEGSNETVEILINTIRKKANRAILTTTDFSEIIKSNPKYFQPESLNLCMYIKQEFNKHTDSSINIIYNCNENIICEIDKMQFSYVIKNLISNAVRHGFQNSTNKIIEVDILKAEAIKNDEKVLIRIKNNGEAIKEGFTIEDFKTLYKKSGEFGNTGIGGYNINIILLNHGGDIKYNNEIIKNTEFNVCFEITLPFKL